MVTTTTTTDPLNPHICAAHVVDGADNGDNDDSENDESALIPDSISYTLPGHLEATVSIPYVHLPQKSQPDFKIRVNLLGPDTIAVKAFQASLYERIIFRVAKTVNMKKRGQGRQTSMSIVGIRERPVSTQRMDDDWRPVSGSHSRQIEKVCQFTTPSTIRGLDELYSSRNCNASTYGRISKSALRRLKEDDGNTSVSPSEIEYGGVDIEVQHFLRFSLFLTGLATSTTGKPVERQLGDIPVVVRGVPGVARCDVTGLPSYLDSFSTSTPSLDEERTYEAATRASLSDGEYISGSTGSTTELETDSSGRDRDSVLSFASLIGLRPSDEDLENDDAFMAIMGLRGYRTLPLYEDSIGRPSLDATSSPINGLHIQPSVSPRADHARDMQNIQ
ncbi:hypothetical protein BGZ65_004272 [Modicella reniformis]|uniref:Uncharacterized protein n=1 Tax=Modicella reniformis TaxID=1440133 RepID=A0A9P6LSW8_9FUNG|nr:hypothetical protein BGZ65_004272 [Modicella reniformis]